MAKQILEYKKFHFGLIKGQLNEIEADLINMKKVWEEGENWNQKSGKIELNEILKDYNIKEDEIDFHKFVLWTPKLGNNWVAYMSNHIIGLHSIKWNLAKRYGRNVIVVHFTNQHRELYPMYFFEYYQGKKAERIVRSMSENGIWKFFEKGKILDFENPNYYERKLDKHKINNEIIISYLSKLGIIVDNSFFQTDQNAIYFDKIDKK